MTVAIVLLAIGIVLSAFFSGAETGFYRANRVRLMLDAMGGDLVAKSLLALTNRPSMFVATVLVGNNLANYVTSLAVVVGTGRLFGGQDHWPQMLAPVALAPILFIYGELMPKNLFYHAPNRMLRACGIPLMICTWLFLPVTALLWSLSQLLERLSGESPEQVHLTLARKELQQVFDQGHEAGLLRPAQRGLAQALFGVASQKVRRFVTPASRAIRVRSNMAKSEMQRIARRHGVSVLLVEGPERSRPLLGYLCTADLYLIGGDRIPAPRPLVAIPENATHIAALMTLEESQELIARVVDAENRTIGFVSARQLSDPLFRAG